MLDMLAIAAGTGLLSKEFRMQPEYRIVKKIRDALHAHGAFVFKVHGGPHMMAGLPDLIVCMKGQFIGVEVKTPDGVLSQRQRYVHNMIRSAGGKVIVATSVDDVRELWDPHWQDHTSDAS